MVTAASELARNAVIYGKGGVVRWEMLDRRRAPRPPARISSTRGRASPICTQAMTDGWTSGTGLGLGLSGARRLVNEFDIETAVGPGHARDGHALEVTLAPQVSDRGLGGQPGRRGAARRHADGARRSASTSRPAARWRSSPPSWPRTSPRHARDGRLLIQALDLSGGPHARDPRRSTRARGWPTCRAACGTATRRPARRATGSARCGGCPASSTCTRPPAPARWSVAPVPAGDRAAGAGAASTGRAVVPSPAPHEAGLRRHLADRRARRGLRGAGGRRPRPWPARGRRGDAGRRRVRRDAVRRRRRR